MDIPAPGGGDGRSGTARDRNLRHLSPKHCRAIYCNNANYGLVYGVGVASRDTGFKYGGVEEIGTSLVTIKRKGIICRQILELEYGLP